MRKLIDRRPWAFAVFYMVVSLLVEIFLIVIVRWKVPEDNGRIAPILLTVPPLLAAGFSGYRRPLKDFLIVAALAADPDRADHRGGEPALGHFHRPGRANHQPLARRLARRDDHEPVDGKMWASRVG